MSGTFVVPAHPASSRAHSDPMAVHVAAQNHEPPTSSLKGFVGMSAAVPSVHHWRVSTNSIPPSSARDRISPRPRSRVRSAATSTRSPRWPLARASSPSTGKDASSPSSGAARSRCRRSPPDRRLVRVLLSGGVSEYVAGRADADCGDLARDLAAALRHRAADLPGLLEASAERIRATVIGASQLSVQLLTYADMDIYLGHGTSRHDL